MPSSLSAHGLSPKESEEKAVALIIGDLALSKINNNIYERKDCCQKIVNLQF